MKPIFSEKAQKPEENRIKKLFGEFEIKKLGVTKVTERIRKEMGPKFHLNRTEADWITAERIKPDKETQRIIDLVGEVKCKSKVIKIN